MNLIHCWNTLVTKKFSDQYPIIMLMGLVIAQDLDLHSASEDDHELEITYEDDQSDEDERGEPESPVVLKTMAGFGRITDSRKNSSSPTLEIMPTNDSATGNHSRYLLCAKARLTVNDHRIRLRSGRGFSQASTIVTK